MEHRHTGILSARVLQQVVHSRQQQVRPLLQAQNGEQLRDTTPRASMADCCRVQQSVTSSRTAPPTTPPPPPFYTSRAVGLLKHSEPNRRSNLRGRVTNWHQRCSIPICREMPGVAQDSALRGIPCCVCNPAEGVPGQ